MKDKIDKLKARIWKKGFDKNPFLSPSFLNSWLYISKQMEENGGMALESFIDAIMDVKIDTEAMIKGRQVESTVLEKLGLIQNDECGVLEGDLVNPIVEALTSYGEKFCCSKNQIITQYSTNKTIDLADGTQVNLNGFVDLTWGKRAFDIKYKGFYTPSNGFEGSMQHRIYLYCLKDIGIRELEYLIITEKGEFWREFYSWREDFEGDIREICRQVIDFVKRL
jgi:hypothetical protein